jgi:hypothetical protein
VERCRLAAIGSPKKYKPFEGVPDPLLLELQLV